MRGLLERELLTSFDLAHVDLQRMRDLNAESAEIPIDEDRENYERVNQEFHFALFQESPLARVRVEVERL